MLKGNIFLKAMREFYSIELHQLDFTENQKPPAHYQAINSAACIKVRALKNRYD